MNTIIYKKKKNCVYIVSLFFFNSLLFTKIFNKE